MTAGAGSSARVSGALSQLTLNDLAGVPFELRALHGRRTVVFCFASW
jgi:phosphoribosylcarboxyaminoimidazole (NCAIR) mutase